MEKGAVMETDLPPSKVLRKVDLYLFWTIMGLSLIPLTLINVTVKVNPVIFTSLAIFLFLKFGSTIVMRIEIFAD